MDERLVVAVDEGWGSFLGGAGAPVDVLIFGLLEVVDEREGVESRVVIDSIREALLVVRGG